MTRLRRLPAVLTLPLVTAMILGAPLAASALPVSEQASVAAGVRADVQEFSFTSYDADYYLARDAQNHSTLRTVESFVAKFPNFDQNRGMIRAIPNDYNGVPLHTAVISVADAKGTAVPYEATDQGGFTELALGTDDFVHGKQTYTITYTQENVVRAFADTGDDELYWDTNGTGFDQPFGTVTARVHVDPAIAPFLSGHNACYQGVEGSTDTCTISQGADAAASDPAAVLLTAGATGLNAGENVSVAIGFTAGTFVQVPAEQTPQDPGSQGGNGFFGGNDGVSFGAESPVWANVVAILFAALAGGGAIFALARRLFFGQRDAKGRGIIIPQYSPPKGVNLMEAAAILKRPSSGLSAQLVSFAVRGNIRILDYPVDEKGGDYTLQLVRADGVDPQEQELLVALFGADLSVGDVRAIGVTNDALAVRLRAIESSVARSVIASGLRAKTSARTGLLLGLGVVVLLVVEVIFAVATAFAGAFSGWIVLAIPVTFVSTFIAFGAASRPAVLTDAGAELRDYLLGMRDYLQLAEADRFRMLQSPQGAERVSAPDIGGVDLSDKAQLVKLYEKLLPFAVLWDIEREWTKELAVYYDQGAASPDWFVSSSTFNSIVFTQALIGLSSSVTTSATPTPPPSSSWSGSGGGSFSGGSFGGGFSGGGGGGGGGGGR